MGTLAVSSPRQLHNPESLFRMFLLLWLLIGALALAATVIVYALPDMLLNLYPFREASGRQAALELLVQFRPLGWLAAAGAGMAAGYLWDARRSLVTFPSMPGAGPEVVSPAITVKRHTVWRWLLLAVVVAALALWLLPVNDGLQDDEADKLLVSTGTWGDWTSNFFNTRINILPITLARTVYLVTQTRQEWLLRLPVFLAFALPLMYVWAVPCRRRYGLIASLLLVIFYGLHYTMGEYATKVQGYLSMLTFAAFQLLIWADMLRSGDRGPRLTQGLLWIAVSIGSFLSHNFALLFTVAQVVTTIIMDTELRLRRANRTAAALTTAFGLLTLAILAGLSLLGIRSILYHLGTSEEYTASGLQFIQQMASAMTGTTSLTTAVCLILYGAAAVSLWRRARGQYRPELYLALVTISLVTLFYLVTTPRFFYARFFIWLPMVWLIILGTAVKERAAALHLNKGALAALSGALMVILLLPSQINWQTDRAHAVNMRVAASAALELASKYTLEGYSVGYLLLASYGNYSHRMWFYLPEPARLSDRNRRAGAFARARRAMKRDIWIIPAARNRFDDHYDWIPDAAAEVIQAGNMGIYVVRDLDFDRRAAEQPFTAASISCARTCIARF